MAARASLVQERSLYSARIALLTLPRSRAAKVVQGNAVRLSNVACADGLLRFRQRATDAPRHPARMSGKEGGAGTEAMNAKRSWCCSGSIARDVSMPLVSLYNLGFGTPLHCDCDWCTALRQQIEPTENQIWLKLSVDFRSVFLPDAPTFCVSFSNSIPRFVDVNGKSELRTIFQTSMALCVSEHRRPPMRSA